MSGIKNLTSIMAFFSILFISNLLCEARLLPVSPGCVQTEGAKFVLNGSSFLFNGFNSYWMMSVAVDPNQRYKISNVFREASKIGLSVCRTWAFNDGGNQALQISPGVYNEPMFQALDFVIAEAKKYGVRLILPLVNNFKDYGGRSQYVQWAKSRGASITTDDDFYTNPVVKGYYKDHVKTVLTRINTITKVTYRDEPTIMAWELMNEPRCQVDPSGKTVNTWIQEMAPYVKSIDPKHLLNVGMEGFYGESIPGRKQYNPHSLIFGTDFIGNDLIKEIDFATIHAYPSRWLVGQNDTVLWTFMRRWMTSHWEDSKTILKKPLVFAEFGKSSKDPGYSVQARDSFLNAVYSSIYNFARNGGTFAGGLVWQIFDEGMDSYDDGYGIVLSKNPSTSIVMRQQSTKMTTLRH